MRPMYAPFVLGAMLLAANAPHPRLVQAEPAAKKKSTGAKHSERTIEPEADKLLRKMSKDMAEMKTFQVDTSQVMEVVTFDGEKIQGLAESTLSVQRPNKLRTDRMGPFGGGSLFYDGSSLTFYGKRDNLYATAKAPDTLDATLDFAREQLSIDAPGADLLHSDPYSVLMEDVVSGRYLGKEVVGGRTCHHLAYRGNEIDFQMWVEDGQRALPCRFVITSKKVTGSPEYEVSMFNWKAEASIPAETFTFTPPPNAAKIDFVRVSDEIKQKREAKR